MAMRRSFRSWSIRKINSSVSEDFPAPPVPVIPMTGTQRSMSTGPSLDQIILGTGIDEEHFRIIEPIPRNHEQNVQVLREELAFDGPSVIVARRACIEAQKRKVV